MSPDRIVARQDTGRIDLNMIRTGRGLVSPPVGRDNGKPGLRKDYGPHYYAAFVVDPDGYRLEAYYGGK